MKKLKYKKNKHRETAVFHLRCGARLLKNQLSKSAAEICAKIPSAAGQNHGTKRRSPRCVPSIYHRLCR